RRTVVLPDPEGPTSTTNSPSAISRSNESTATVPSANRFVSCRNSIAAISAPTSVLPCRLLLGDQVAVPERAPLQHAPLGGVVDVHEAEALRVSMLPLEVVEERPRVVAANVRATVDRPR